MTNASNLLEPKTISTDKIELIEHPKDSILPTGFRFIDLSILLDVFSLLACPNCSTTNTLKLQDIGDKRAGLARFMQIKCRDCEFKHIFYTSPRVDSTKDNCTREMKTMEINVRVVYGFRSIGVNHTPVTKLCGIFNMPPPMTKNVFDDLSYSIKVVSKQVAEKSIPMLPLDNGKVLDVAILSKSCKG